MQVSNIQNIPAGDFEIVLGAHPVLIKNITQDEVQVQVKLCKMASFVTTTFYPGWNPELVVALKAVSANTLQYGN